jgi:Ca2+-binding RTX toxin-like protein
MRSMESYRFLLVGVLTVAIFSSSIILLSPVSNQSSAFGTISGENRKIVFSSTRDGNWEVYTMNAEDGSGQTNISNNPASDGWPEWAPTQSPPPPTCEGQTATIVGTLGNDNNIVGTSGRDVIAALEGNERVRSLDGNDIVCGGEGNDIVDGGGGTDRLFGDAPNGEDGGTGTDNGDGGPDFDRCVRLDTATNCEG